MKSKFLNLQSTNNLQKTKEIICNTLYWVVNKSEMNTPKSKGDASLKGKFPVLTNNLEGAIEKKGTDSEKERLIFEDTVPETTEG